MAHAIDTAIELLSDARLRGFRGRYRVQLDADTYEAFKAEVSADPEHAKLLAAYKAAPKVMVYVPADLKRCGMTTAPDWRVPIDIGEKCEIVFDGGASEPAPRVESEER